MTSQALKMQYNTVKRTEKRIKLLEDLQKTIIAMNKLNSCFDLNEVLMNNPKFDDDFFLEVEKVTDNLKLDLQ